jgi:hypothetical protein
MTKHESPETGSRAIVSTPTVDAPSIKTSSRQIVAVGPVPGVEDLLIGSLMYSSVAEVSAVARFYRKR